MYFRPIPFTFPWKAVSIALSGLFLLTAGCVREEGDTTYLQFSYWGSVEQQRVEQEIIDGFEAEHPGVRISILPIGQRYADKIQAMMVGNAAPDIISIEMTRLDEWASRGALLDLTEDMEQIMAEREVMPIPLKAAERNGKFYAIPASVNGFAVYVNLTAFEKAGVKIPKEGLSWDFIEEVAYKLSNRYGDPAAATDYALLLPEPMTMIWAEGGDVFDDPSDPTRSIINSPETARAMERYRRLRSKRYAVPPDMSADQGTFQLFRDGKIALYFDGRWRTPDFREIDNFEWDVMSVPSGPGGRKTRHGGTFLGVSVNTKHPELAREFIRYYVAGEGTQISMRGGRMIPIFRDMAYGDEFLNSTPPPSIHVFSDTMEEGASSVPLYGTGLMEANLMISRRMQQIEAYPELAVETILSGLERDLNRWLTRRKERLADIPHASEPPTTKTVANPAR